MNRLLILPLLALAALAQVDTGTLSGVVRDSSGAVVPGAKVTITNTGTGQKLEIATRDQGIYVSPPLRPGEYTVEVEAQGFRKMARSLPLDVSQRAVVDFDLPVGSVSEEVIVSGEAPVLQTETATLSNLRTEQTIKDLPLNGRNFAQLIQLSAGVTPTQTQVGGLQIVQKRGIANVSVNGTRHEENNFLVEGLSNNENHNGNGLMMFPSVDAIQEFRVESSVADAQFGRGGGGTINMTYKSGTQRFHGGLYEFVRNERLDAKNFFDRAEDPIPPFKQNQYGVFLGGPVFPWRGEHKTFFFADFEGLKARQSQTYISTVPTAAFREGDFSSSTQQLFDPLTQRQLPNGTFVRDPFPGNRIPIGRIDPVGRNILNIYPEPNLGTADFNNYLANPLRTTDGYKFDVKIDQIISEKDTFFARWSRSGDDLNEPGALPEPAVGNGPGVPGLASQPLNQIVASGTHLFSADKVNEIRAGWTRLNLRQFNPNFGRYVSHELGVPGGNVVGDELTSGLSIFTVTGQTALGDNGFSPAVVVSDNLQLSDNFNYIRGSHTFKFGGEIQRRRYNAFQSNTLRGSMAFNAAYTQNPASRTGTGLGAADVLLGRPASGTIRFLNGTRGFRRSEYSLYAQDTWKATSKLTVTLGMRYELFAGWPWTEVNNRMYQFVPSLGTVAQVGTDAVPWRSGAPGDHNNLGPRVGIAYKITGKTVFRGGYGLFYSAPQWDVTRNLGANPPEFIVSGFNNDQFNFIGARTASQGFDRPEQGTITGSLRALDPTVRTPYTQQWNASLQHELPASISLTLAYVGTKGTRLQGYPDTNQAVPGDGPVDSRRAFSQFQNIQTIQTRFNSSYNSLQITGERRFSSGLGFLVGYTWGHVIDDVASQFGDFTDSRNIRLDRGNSGIDLRHKLIMSWTYELPFKAAGKMNHLVGGWQVNGILSFYTGFSFSVASAVNTLNAGRGTRADRIGQGQLPKSEQALDRWFDTSAFTAPGFRQFGTGGRNILTGPGTRQLDASLFKEFRFSEDGVRRLEFRTEFFNFTNTPQFNDPAASFGSPGFGQIRSAGSPQSLQRTPRQIQFGLKFYF
ncbi:MAG: TonB-dependent receptor [Bryobacteraceae bacterium]